jgi:hypothetical protein
MASSSSPTDTVDPLEAKSVARSLWAGISAALSAGDTGALRVFEAGPLLESDIGAICQVGCPPQQFSTPLQVSVNVPHQSGYPATFLATVTYQTGCHAATSPCVNQFIAVQPAKGAPWKAMLRIQYGGPTNSQQAHLLPDGYAVAPADPATARISDLLADFSNYEDTLKRTGVPPTDSLLADGPFTSDRAPRLYDPPDAQAARGVHVTGTYTVDPADPTYVFATAAGGMTMCGDIRYAAELTSATGDPLDASVAVDEWKMRLTPGRYSSISLVGLDMLCFERLPTDAHYTVVANWGGNTAVAGQSAPPPAN